jgi:hypothetical protein
MNEASVTGGGGRAPGTVELASKQQGYGAAAYGAQQACEKGNLWQREPAAKPPFRHCQELNQRQRCAAGAAHAPTCSATSSCDTDMRFVTMSSQVGWVDMASTNPETELPHAQYPTTATPRYTACGCQLKTQLKIAAQSSAKLNWTTTQALMVRGIASIRRGRCAAQGPVDLRSRSSSQSSHTRTPITTKAESRARRMGGYVD